MSVTGIEAPVGSPQAQQAGAHAPYAFRNAVFRHRASLALLAACAGVVDLLSIVRLGGALTGILTGDLVNTADEIGTDRWTLIRYPVVAIVGFCLGAFIWSYGLRRASKASSRPTRIALLVEAVVLVSIPIGLAFTNGDIPVGSGSLVLLGLAALALGGQSATSLRDGVSTTYMTGGLTSAMHSLATGGAHQSVIANLGRASALLGGALVAAWLLSAAWWSAAILPPILVVAALLIYPRGGPGRF